ncbi:hypothetical protein B9Z19DRAFT_327503 [Tuber borchii]|uniref:Uncharacterized protein n=1 Tax=Tuber borchii TaxID=42251 RepID=A0A2T7A4Y7_TUBBO|nr:hypothetical protein B9Z19DRAFT_327503 [Tuber borchii]
MPTPNGPLQEFFSQFNFQRYTYDPHKPAFEEFQRLCQARQWGASKIGEHEPAFLFAIEREQDIRRSLAGPNAPLQEFFSQFNFQRYTYDPHNPALEEFKRLCQERLWGPSKIREHETAFLLAVEREKDLRGSLTGPNVFLQEFFSQFNFERYTYDPHTPALEEFKRLCQARQWGYRKIREHETEFLLAVGRGQDRRESLPGPNVIEFFIRYEYPLFTYNLDASPKSELQRLAGLRKWGEANLSQVTEQFNKAVALDAREKSGYAASESTDSEDLEEQEVDLLVDWMWKQECCEYSYRGALPELNFRKLKRWKPVNEESEDSLSSTGSCEFEPLHIKFTQVVEEVFNSLLDEFCEITGFTPQQVLVGLYGQRRQGAEKQKAETVLGSVFVNIFDFLDVFQEILENPPTTNSGQLLRLLRPRATELQFPNEMMLGVYSSLTGRVFPFNVASKNGILALLLHPLKGFWKGRECVTRKFKREAGDELQATMEREGCAGVRRLILSREWDCFRRR